MTSTAKTGSRFDDDRDRHRRVVSDSGHRGRDHGEEKQVSESYTTLKLAEDIETLWIENLRLRRLLEQNELSVRELPSDLWTSEMQPDTCPSDSDSGEQRRFGVVRLRTEGTP
jgi:hypothetical protein